jgi:hypothetical protein
MSEVKNILFASVLSIPILDKQKATNEILSLDKSFSFWDNYRYTQMFPLMTKSGYIGVDETSNEKNGGFTWTEVAGQTPTIVDWCNNFVFPWIGMKTRVMALVTQPGEANHEHFDCNANELDTLQHKFRIVLQGKTDTLYWLTNKGQVNAPNIEHAFIMNGGWPHGMVNTGNKPKVTIALGAPWCGKDDYGVDIEILQKKDKFKMPKKIHHLWKN